MRFPEIRRYPAALVAGLLLALAFPLPGWSGLAWLGPGLLAFTVVGLSIRRNSHASCSPVAAAMRSPTFCSIAICAASVDSFSFFRISSYEDKPIFCSSDAGKSRSCLRPVSGTVAQAPSAVRVRRNAGSRVRRGPEIVRMGNSLWRKSRSVWAACRSESAAGRPAPS